MTVFLGLMGTHGTGKTSLAQAYADKHPGTTFIKTGISDVYKSLGLDPKVRMSLNTRMDVQEKVLDYLCDQWEKGLLEHGLKEGNIISDRTPYDLIAYTLAEVSGYEDIDEKLDQRIAFYITRCRIAAQTFDSIVHVPIYLQVSSDPAGKVRASNSMAYRYHLDLLMIKQAEEDNCKPHRLVNRKMEDRIEELEQVFSKA